MTDKPTTENLTLIGRTLPLATVRTCLEGRVDGEMTVQGTEPDWEQIAIRSGKGSLQFSAMKSTVGVQASACETSVPFTRLQTAMTAIAKIAKGASPNVQKKVIEQIQKAHMLIAVVGTPRLNALPGGRDAIDRIAQEMNALVFDGEAFQDPRGRPLLTLPGDDDD